MNIIYLAQTTAVILLCIVLCLHVSLIMGQRKLKHLFSKEYIKVIQIRSVRQLYPFVPKISSSKYHRTKRFLTSIGWNVSVEGIYLCKWTLFAITFFVLVTIQTTNTAMELKEIVLDINYNHNIVDTLKQDTPQTVALEERLFDLANQNLTEGNDLYKRQNKQVYVEYIENLFRSQGLEAGEKLGETAERIYQKVLRTRMIRSSVTPYIYISLFSCLVYYAPDLLGQIKKKLIEDKKNWEILHCLIIFSIFGRMPPFSVVNILEHMAIATEVYKPIFESLIEGLKKGGNQEQVFDAALEAVDRDELYELIETMKIARKTGLVNTVDDVEDTIGNTIKWIEIENITRRHSKTLYAMTAVAVVIGLGCIYFAYGLTVISNPANMLIK